MNVARTIKNVGCERVVDISLISITFMSWNIYKLDLAQPFTGCVKWIERNVFLVLKCKVLLVLCVGDSLLTV